MRDRMQELKQMLETGLVLFLVGFMAVGPWAPRAWAGPELQEVVHGEIEVSTVGNTTTIDSSAVSIGNYGCFDIAGDERVEVLFSGMGDSGQQQNGRHLARVMNGIETQLLGQLFSPGHVYIVNPAGVFIGAGGVIDVAGFHAAAGDIDENEFLDADPGEDHYTSLVGQVRNYGEINARIVDLVGRYVLNAEGARIWHRGGADEALDGFFVLVAGEDVIIARDAPTDDAARERGELNVTVRITGLAGELLEALDDGEKVGVEQNGEVAANDADASSDQASVGQVVVGAAAEPGSELGSGDLAGIVMFGSQSRTLAQDIVAMARGGDVEIAGSDSGDGAYFDAENVELCAGLICDAGFIGQPVGQEAEGGDFDRVVIGDGARFNMRVPKYYPPEPDPDDPDPLPPPPGPGDLAGQFTLRQDADLDFDLQVGDSSDADATIIAAEGGDEEQGPLVDLDIESRGQLTVEADLEAREMTLVAGLDGERAGDLVLGSDAVDIALRGEVMSLRAGDGIGSPDDVPTEQASIRGVNEATFEFVNYRPDQDDEGDDGIRQSLTLEQDAAILVGRDEAGMTGFDPDALSNPDSSPDHDLVLISADDVEVGGFEDDESLTVDRLTLQSGSDLTGDLVVGPEARLNADQFLLEAGSRVSDRGAVVTIDEGAAFGARVQDQQIERFHVYQHGDIGVDALPRFLPGQDAPAVFKIESSRGRVAFDEAAARRILGDPTGGDLTDDDPTNDVYTADTTELILSNLTGDIWLQPSLELQALRVGDTDFAWNFVTSASLHTLADMSFQASRTILGSEDSDTVAAAGDQEIYAEGTLSVRGLVAKNNGGSLILQADGNTLEAGDEDIPPITLENSLSTFSDLLVDGGDLEIRSSFRTDGLIRVGTGSADPEEPHTLIIAPLGADDTLVGEFRCRTSCAGLDDIYADRLTIGANGSTVTLQNRVASVSDSGETSWLPGGELRLSTREDLEIPEKVSFDAGLTDGTEESAVRIESEGAITFQGDATADAVKIHAGTDGSGDLTIGWEDHGGELDERTVHITADEITLRAGAGVEPDPDDTTPLAAVTFNDRIEFETDSFSLIEDATITSSMLPDTGAFTGAGAMGYSVESTLGTVEIAAGETQLDGHILPEWNVALAAYDSIQVLGTLIANAISIHAGKGNEAGADLVLGDGGGATPVLTSGSILLRAGIGDDDAAKTESQVIVNEAQLVGPAATGDSLQLTFQQDAAIDDTTRIQDVAGIVDQGLDMTYRLISDGAGIDLSEEDFAARLGSGHGDGVRLELEAAEDITIGTDLTLSSLSAHAGTDGGAEQGDLTIRRTVVTDDGEEIEEELVLRADAFELRAGRLPDSAQAILLAEGEQAAAVVIGERTRFGATSDDERIARFALEQDASVAAAQLTHTHFELDPGVPIVPDELRIASARGDVEAHDTALISDTELGVEALGGVSLGDADSGPTLLLQSLDLVSGQGATLHQSIAAIGANEGAVGTIDIQGDVGFDGTGLRMLATDAGGRISIEGNLEYRPGDPGPNTLSLMAADGQLEITGMIDTSGDLEEAEGEGGPQDGANVQIHAGEVDVGVIDTAGAGGGDGGAVTIVASGDQEEVGISLRDDIYTFDSTQPADAQGQAGEVLLVAGVIQIGSAIETDSEDEFVQAETQSQNIRIEGGDIAFGGKVVSAVPVLLGDDGLPVPAADLPVSPAQRNLIITSRSGSVEFTGEVGNAEQEGRLDLIQVASARDVSFGDRVWLRDREASGSSGGTTGGNLLVRAERDVELRGDIVAGNVDIHASKGAEEESTGNLLAGSGKLEVLADITADEITLRVGNGLGEGDELEDELMIDEETGFLARGDSLAPDVTLHQEAGFSADDIDAIIEDHILEANGISDERPDVRVGFISDAGTVTVNADTVAGMRLQLGGNDTDTAGVFVNGPLEVRELDLDSDAHIQGDLRVTGPSTASSLVDERAGLRVQGDLTVAGDLELLTLLRLDGDLEDAKQIGEGEPVQTVTVEGGGFVAPAIERVSSRDDVIEVVIRTQDDVGLRGTLRDNSFASGIQSADISYGSLRFENDVLALGNLEAQSNLTFAEGTSLSLDEQYEDDTVSHDQIVLAHDGSLVVHGPVNKQGSSGPLGDGSLVFGGGSGFEIRQSDPRPISAVGDLSLVGAGVIAGGAGPRTIESEQGDLALIGGVTWTGGDLTLNAGDGDPDEASDDRSILLAGTTDVGENAITLENAVRTDLLAAEHLVEAIDRESLMPEDSRPDSAQVLGGRVDFTGTIQGDASLSVDAGTGSIELRGDVEMQDSATLALHSSAEGGIRFSKQEGAQTVRAGSIELNPDGQTPTPLANIVRNEGDLRLEASDDHLTMGAGTRMSVVGELMMDAARTAQLADTSAFQINVTAPVIGVVSRPPAIVARPDGSTVLDEGTDIVANRIVMSTQPLNRGGGLVSFATPTGTEISDNMWSDDVQIRAIYPDLRPLSTDDFDSNSDFQCIGGTCDLVALGTARFEAGRELAEAPRPIGLQEQQALAELNAVNVSARPLWAEELIAHLERASLGGDVLTAAESDDPRLDNSGVAEAVRIYRNLFAPIALYDETTGARMVRSHRERIRDVLGRAIEAFRAARPGEPLGGSGFGAFLEASQHGEALFYLSTLGDLVSEARRAGLSDVEAERFARLLAEGITPDGVDLNDLAAAILASEPAQQSDPGIALGPGH